MQAFNNTQLYRKRENNGIHLPNNSDSTGVGNIGINFL